MDPNLEDLISLVKVQLGIHALDPMDRFVEDLGAESMDLLNIVASTEEAFGIDLEESELMDVRSIRNLHDLIQSRLGRL